MRPHPSTPRRFSFVVASLLLTMLATGSGTSRALAALHHTRPTTTPLTRWLNYHLNAAHTGDDTTEPSFANLGAAWTAGPVDGALFGEPLVYGNNIIVGTENDSLYSFGAAAGKQHWHVSIGTPRTSNFPCGNINPLGITGTPVIDGGYLYAVAEVEQPVGTYRFHLAKVNPGTGAVVYNTDITPTGMDANTQQQRSALAVSKGNVIVAWGGLDGDCRSYHGYVESVSESSGAEVAQWNDTASDNAGGIWGASGPVVGSLGNMYVTTGNGSSTNINAYDYSDSVVRLSPTMSVLSFFAPGPPQQWTYLNSSDTDLASVGPVALSDGLIFAIGKGGRGYLLNPTKLPSNSNPGGGENFSAQVCKRTHDAAFSGLAAAGNTIYVPCVDGIAAVMVDSLKAFHTLWYSTSGSSAPIVAGGLVWTVNVFGGSTLYGLDPATGAVLQQLSLGATTEHFVTPSSGGGRLFIAAGDLLMAFAPH